MMPDEKSRLLALLQPPRAWCQHAEARDGEGNPVRFDDQRALAWDLTGALCHLFGWRRAAELFCQLHRHIGARSRSDKVSGFSEFQAMSALQDFNDSADMTHERLLAAVSAVPVWRGCPAGDP